LSKLQVIASTPRPLQLAELHSANRVAGFPHKTPRCLIQSVAARKYRDESARQNSSGKGTPMTFLVLLARGTRIYASRQFFRTSFRLFRTAASWISTNESPACLSTALAIVSSRLRSALFRSKRPPNHAHAWSRRRSADSPRLRTLLQHGV